MAAKNVWASHRLIQAAWVDYPPDTGYDHVFSFNSLTDLCGQMAPNHLLGKVQILGLVAHGPQFNGGVIDLDRELTVASIHGFEVDFQLLTNYLTRSATLVFYSCTAGYDVAGSELLSAISSRLPGRTIIGFTVWGITDPRPAPTNPGVMSYTRVPDVTKSEGLLSPGGPFAKWARDGQIIRLPAPEGVWVGGRAGGATR